MGFCQKRAYASICPDTRGIVIADHHFWLSEAQFTRLRPLLPTKVRSVPQVDDRRVISGIIHVIRNGLRWRDAPACYGPPKTLYNHFVLPFNWNLLGDGTHTVRALADGVEFDRATFTVTTDHQSR